MATIMAGESRGWGGGIKKERKKEKNKNHKRDGGVQRFILYLTSCAMKRSFVLRFRGRDPSEAAAHRQKRGGCLQLDSTLVQE